MNDKGWSIVSGGPACILGLGTSNNKDKERHASSL